VKARLLGGARAALGRHGLRAAVVGALAFVSIRSVLAANGGEPAVPLDDAYIHFQYARAFFEGRGFEFSAGAPPTPGATSLLWPAALALFYGAGLREENVIWAAWLLGFVTLGFLGHETRRVCDRLLSSDGGLAAEAMVYAFGGFLWFAGSGMEVVPLGFLLMRTARRAAEWVEAGAPSAWPTELIALAYAGPLLRPEGTLATLLVALALGGAGRGRRRGFAAVALLGAFLPGLVNFLGTGQASTTTATVKWLPLSPYHSGAGLFGAIWQNVELLFGTLLDGRIWSAVFLPEGAGLFLWLAPIALVVVGARPGVRFRAGMLLVIACGIVIPTTYDSFLWNRLRYLWPFMPAWFVGVAALSELVGRALGTFESRLVRVRLLVSGVAVGGLADHLPFTISDLASSARAISAQQVALGRWAKDALPQNAVIGVNDTGAIAYYSRRRVFDVVGLTTIGEGRYWVAGAGSRFEHYERLDRRALPTDFIVYPEWFALPELFGDYRTARSVPGATILGGETMAAYRADYRALGTGARLGELTTRCRPFAELDVADLESESLAEYELFEASAADNVTRSFEGVTDGGRKQRTRERFRLALPSGGRLVARLSGEPGALVTFRADARALGGVSLTGAPFEEVSLPLPTAAVPVARELEIEVGGGTFASFHYWALPPCPP
jgi:hypothetical protein